jgi:F-type H+-transporting ATPase subunit gamma
MPSLKAIRTRIASVKNTQKITKAMKLVAAARLRRAQAAIVAARPYATRMEELFADVVQRVQEDVSSDKPLHPMLQPREVHKVRLVIVTSDRGLAGGLNAGVLRRLERFVVEEGAKYESIEVTVVGRKGREYLRRRTHKVNGELAGATSETSLDLAREIAQHVTQDYIDGKIDAVFVIYNEFRSAISQEVKLHSLLPLGAQLNLVKDDKGDKKTQATPKEQQEHERPADFEYEPSAEAVLDHLIPLYIETVFYRAMLESVASEFGARMSAMDSATKNAKEMISTLTLQFNRARQAAITKELSEIVSGAESLKG